MLAADLSLLNAILIIIACGVGFFGGMLIYGFFFSSGEDADNSFREAAEYPCGQYSWGWLKIMTWLGVSVVIGVLAYKGLSAVVRHFSAHN